MFKMGENKSVRRAMVVIDKLKAEGYTTIKQIEMGDYHCKIVLESGLKKTRCGYSWLVYWCNYKGGSGEWGCVIQKRR